MDRLLALPRELREMIHAYLTPEILEARVNSVYVTPNKSVRAVSALHGRRYRDIMALSAANKAMHQDVLNTIAGTVCLSIVLSRNVGLTDRVPKGARVAAIPPTLISRLSRLEFVDMHLLIYIDCETQDSWYIGIRCWTCFKFDQDGYLSLEYCCEAVDEDRLGQAGDEEQTTTKVQILRELDRRLVPCAEQLAVRGHFTVNMLRKIQGEHFFESKVFEDMHGQWKLLLTERLYAKGMFFPGLY